MQATSDIFLGWLHVDSGLDGQPRDFYVRQLKDWKGSALIEQMNPTAMISYGKLCGWTLARAHARSGDRIAIASYLGASDAFDQTRQQARRRDTKAHLLSPVATEEHGASPCDPTRSVSRRSRSACHRRSARRSPGCRA